MNIDKDDVWRVEVGGGGARGDENSLCFSVGEGKDENDTNARVNCLLCRTTTVCAFHTCEI